MRVKAKRCKRAQCRGYAEAGRSPTPVRAKAKKARSPIRLTTKTCPRATLLTASTIPVPTVSRAKAASTVPVFLGDPAPDAACFDRHGSRVRAHPQRRVSCSRRRQPLE